MSRIISNPLAFPFEGGGGNYRAMSWGLRGSIKWYVCDSIKKFKTRGVTDNITFNGQNVETKKRLLELINGIKPKPRTVVVFANSTGYTYYSGAHKTETYPAGLHVHIFPTHAAYLRARREALRGG